MAEWSDAMNAYEVLGLEQGPKATEAEIGKVGRIGLPSRKSVAKLLHVCTQKTSVSSADRSQQRQAARHGPKAVAAGLPLRGRCGTGCWQPDATKALQ